MVREGPGRPVPALEEIRSLMRQRADPKRAEILRRFFKTGPGQYGEGDRFLGLRVPDLRKIARRFPDLTAAKTARLLKSGVHEERLLALFLLVGQYGRGTPQARETIYRIYLSHTRYINNWDLVDSSAEQIVGAHLWNQSRDPLYALATSGSLWERRISILSCFHFIKRNDFDDLLGIARMLLRDPEDLIHKAVGWMLREVGKRDLSAEESFLRQHSREMPRTMLRYAIERFPEPKRKNYLRGTV
jgi:3-methyladenine DNA glycosylase AlkD